MWKKQYKLSAVNLLRYNKIRLTNYVKYPLFNKTLEIIEIFQGIIANSFYFIFILCAWVFASIYVCKPHVCLVQQRLKNESDPLDHDTVVGWVLKSFLQPHDFHIRRIISGKKRGGLLKGTLTNLKSTEIGQHVCGTGMNFSSYLKPIYCQNSPLLVVTSLFCWGLPLILYGLHTIQMTICLIQGSLIYILMLFLNAFLETWRLIHDQISGNCHLVGSGVIRPMTQSNKKVWTLPKK